MKLDGLWTHLQFVLSFLFSFFKTGVGRETKRKEINALSQVAVRAGDTHGLRMQARRSHCSEGYLQNNLKCKHTSEDIIGIA